MTPKKQKQLLELLAMLNMALAKKARCSQQDIYALKAVLEQLQEKVMHDRNRTHVDYLRDRLHNQEQQIVQLGKMIVQFEKRHKKKLKQMNNAGTPANTNQKGINLFAGGMATGSVAAMIFSIWLAMGQTPAMLNNDGQEIAGLMNLDEAQIALIEEDDRKGLSLFDEKVALDFINKGLINDYDFGQIAYLNQVSDQFALSPKHTPRIQTEATTSIEGLTKKAKAGDAWAAYDLGVAFVTGEKVDKDYVQAKKWFKQSALDGIANSQYNLAVMLHQGLGDQENIEEALFWYSQAAVQDHPQALYNLAVAHADGLGTDVDHETALDYFKQAYDQGVDKAAFYVATLYEAGALTMGEADYVQAQLWYERASMGGNTAAFASLERLEKENKIASNMSGVSASALNAIETAAP